MFYAPQLFNSLGHSEQQALVTTCIIGAVKVVSTPIAIIFVDR
jgi:hypothetical protein